MHMPIWDLTTSYIAVLNETCKIRVSMMGAMTNIQINSAEICIVRASSFLSTFKVDF